MPIISDILWVWKESDAFCLVKAPQWAQVCFCGEYGGKQHVEETQSNYSNANDLQIVKAVR